MEKEDTDFLHNTDFITWRITKDPYLEAYWEEYLSAHPEQKDAFGKAVKAFSGMRMNDEALGHDEQAALLQRIRTSGAVAERRTLRRTFIRYAAAACVVLAVGLSFLYYKQSRTDEFRLLAEDLIVGENLEEQEIYLVSDSATYAFSKDIHLQIVEDGSAAVKEKGGISRQIETSKSALTKLVVPYGKRSQLTLSDGTKVWLNSGSVLEFPTVFTGKSRRVSLSGEMYAEVAKDAGKPFIVSTQGYQVKVYGTKFNLSAYKDHADQSVVLVEGSVGVRTSADNEIMLSPNEMLTGSRSAWDKKTVDVSDYISWKDGYMILNKTPITEVLRKAERYYNLTFNIPPSAQLEHITCTGKIYLSDNLDNVMGTISLLSHTRYKREDKTIYIEINP